MMSFDKTKPMQKELIKKPFYNFNYLQNSEIEAIKLYQVCARFKN
jgi:hypothetical protein